MILIDNNGNLTKLLICVAFSFWIYWIWLNRKLYKACLKFPHVIGLPIIGCLYQMRNVDDLLSGISRLFEICKHHTVYTWVGLYACIFTSDPELAKLILSSSEMLHKTIFYRGLEDFIGNGLLTSTSREWGYHRKLLAPTLIHKTILSYFPVFNKIKNFAIVKLKSMSDTNKPCQLDEILQTLAVGMSTETTLGKSMKYNDTEIKELTNVFMFALRTVNARQLLICLNIDWILNLSIYYDILKAEVKHFIYKLMQKRYMIFTIGNQISCNMTKKASCLKEETPSYFIDQAVQLYEQNLLTWEDVINQTSTMIIGSFEPTSNVIFSTLVMLSTHPYVQERVFYEILHAFPEKDFEMNFEDIVQLPYLDMIIKETMRLAPPFPVIGRQTTSDVEIGNDLVLPKGLQINISLYHLHRRTDIWGPNAHEFNPDNFLPANIDSRHSWAFLPFSKGNRNCIGWRYAMHSIYVILTGLIRNFRFTTTAKYDDLEFVSNIFLQFKIKPMLKMYKRL